MSMAHAYLQSKVISWFVRFIQIQLILTIVSLPLVASWGLPLSVLAPVGNLIFSPFLALFLIISCFVFCFELVHIPNVWLIHILERLTAVWLKLINLADVKWLIGFPAAQWYVLTAIPLSAFFVLRLRIINTPAKSMASLCAILAFSIMLLKIWCTPYALISHIPCNNGQVTLVKQGKTVVLVDPGYIGQRISMPSWIEYTLRSELIKQTGSPAIETLIMLQPGKLVFEAIEHICTKLQVSRVYLPIWQGMLTKKEWRSFAQMKKKIAEKKIQLFRVPFWHATHIPFDQKMSLLITPMQRMIQQADIKYALYCALWRVDNKQVTIYSAKHKKIPTGSERYS